MTKEEFFNEWYPGLKWINLSESCKMIQNALWDAKNEKGDNYKDSLHFKFAYQVCVPIYNKIREYEDQLKNDFDELNGKHGTPAYSVETIDEISALIQEMAFICDTYHRYFEFVDISLLTNSDKKNEENEQDGQQTIFIKTQTQSIETGLQKSVTAKYQRGSQIRI